MFVRFLSLVAVVVLSAGCGLKAQTYVMSKERVDIQKTEGNGGFLMGNSQYQEPDKKTRKVYILEITKSIPESEAKRIEQEVSTSTSAVVEREAPQVQAEETPKPAARKIVIPAIKDEEAAPEVKIAAEKVTMGPTEAVSYTVQKDDTLQKISKKYYGTYSGWLKIYNANKEKIKNPNLLRSGTVITIPAAN